MRPILRSGGIVVLDAGWGYRRRVNRDQWRVRALLLRGPWAERLSRRLAPAFGVAEYRRPAAAWREHITTAVEAILASRRGWDWVAMAELARLLHGLCAPADQQDDGLAARTARLVAAAPERKWHVAALARALDRSESGFAHRFTQETGVSPARWLRKWRVGQAQRLLADHAPGEVAEILGFATPFHFSRVFREEVGVSPSAWRARTLV